MIPRRTFVKFGFSIWWVKPTVAALRQHDFEAAADILADAHEAGDVRAASLLVKHAGREWARLIGDCKSDDDAFLIASISKPLSAAALMTLCESHQLSLDDKVSKFIPEFKGAGRESIDLRQLLTHVCGLPDQLPENASLRKRHAPLSEFVRHAIRTPLLFRPGSKYSYSSMGILLASEIAQRITDTPFPQLVKQNVFEPLGMKHSALGLGDFKLNELMQCQTERAARESGAGDPDAKSWDWNSAYWRSLGSPWGGVHSTTKDIARFLEAFLHPNDWMSRSLTEAMIRNHNPAGIRSRGLGFDLGTSTSSEGCSPATFGHGGSTGTLAWADPVSDTIFVVLTTLPNGAVQSHPRQQVSDEIAKMISAA